MTTKDEFSLKDFLIDYPPPEPLNVADCPHPAGTADHSQWIKELVIDRQYNTNTQFWQEHQRARRAALEAQSVAVHGTTRAENAKDLDDMIADLPGPNWRLPPKETIYEVVDRWGIKLDIAPSDFARNHITVLMEERIGFTMIERDTIRGIMSWNTV